MRDNKKQTFPDFPGHADAFFEILKFILTVIGLRARIKSGKYKCAEKKPPRQDAPTTTTKPPTPPPEKNPDTPLHSCEAEGKREELRAWDEQ